MEIPFSERFFLHFVHGAPKLKIHVLCFCFLLVSLSGFDPWECCVEVVVALSDISGRGFCLLSSLMHPDTFLKSHRFPATDLLLLCSNIRKHQQYIFYALLFFTLL